MPKWKKDLYTNNGLKIPGGEQNNVCVNSLQLNSSMDEFGIGHLNETAVLGDSSSHLKNTSGQFYRVLVHFYPELREQLLTNECYELEMTLKFMVRYRKFYNVTSIELNNDRFDEVY